MSNAKLIKNVCVGGGQICYRKITQQQALKHWFVDYPARLSLVSAYGLHFCILDGGLNRVFINAIEVDVFATGRIRLDTEGH